MYLDNILIYLQMVEEHCEHLKAILEALWANKLYAKISKYIFSQKEV
jgi:hypothetical protein